MLVSVQFHLPKAHVNHSPLPLCLPLIGQYSDFVSKHHLSATANPDFLISSDIATHCPWWKLSCSSECFSFWRTSFMFALFRLRLKASHIVFALILRTLEFVLYYHASYLTTIKVRGKPLPFRTFSNSCYLLSLPFVPDVRHSISCAYTCILFFAFVNPFHSYKPSYVPHATSDSHKALLPFLLNGMLMSSSLWRTFAFCPKGSLATLCLSCWGLGFHTTFGYY